MNKRLFVRKKKEYAYEDLSLLQALNNEFQFNFKTLTSYIVYDVFNIKKEILEQAKHTVFSEIMIDEVHDDLELVDMHYFAYETLPTQYDQRADSAMQCIVLIGGSKDTVVRTGRLLVFDRCLKQDELKKIQSFLVNPIESRVKDMSVLENTVFSKMKELKDLSGFNYLDEKSLLELKQEMSLAMNIQDLVFVQDYFKTEHRDPSETELYVLDCYWSDHCRHTTFETILDEISIDSNLFQQEMQDAYNRYLQIRTELNNHKAITLMDMASVVGKYHRNVLQDQHIEVSEEINACSFFVNINNQGKDERWLIQFKNETHNHPTEIEPFGGASTCIGGAIRDPLSGRSYVYQAMRISGCANVLTKREDTLQHKLAQVDIARGASHGYSSYGNQIGLATSYVKELYDDSYVAKHMEVGAVVGAVKVGDYKRESVVNGDIVVVIGGRTGRDGIQGASGSSVVHTNDSLETASSQVQKGNAIEERKIQRLFRNPAVTKLIKKCNDFGAGGVCVAIGELAEGIEIHLDKMLVKYQGLNATEIATSESQERMAVVLDPNDYQKFILACEAENIEYSHVATITDKRRLVMYYQEQKVVDMGADFLATAGVKQHAKAKLVDQVRDNPFVNKNFDKKSALEELSSLNVCNQKGLVSMFDSSIGATTVLMPYAGKYQMTPVQASVQALPVLDGSSDTATVLTYGFIPKISHYSPFISSIYAVMESVAKVYAVGANHNNLYFSFQEYFEKLGTSPEKWGKVTQILLGSIYAQESFKRPSIGGKDSMSGTFNDLNVVETFISFACTTMKIKDVITPELKQSGNKLYFIPVEKDEKSFPDIVKTLKKYQLLNQYILEGKVVSAYVLEEASLFSSLVKMALGNGLGFTIDYQDALKFNPASIVVEATSDLDFDYIGTVSEDVRVNGVSFVMDELYDSYTKTLEPVYRMYENLDQHHTENIKVEQKKKRYYSEYVEDVQVVIPVFPGTNCEYDSAKAFQQAGASTRIVVIRNKKEDDIAKSIEDFIKACENAHIIMFPGGFSSGDEPDGSAKFIVNFLKNEKVKNAIHKHLSKKKLILGICNGFQALIKSGLIPYGEIRDLTTDDLTLYRNTSYKHVSTTAFTRVANNNCIWTQDFNLDQIHEVVFSHGEGRLVGNSIDKFKQLVCFQYCDLNGQASLNGKCNPNGSTYAIEGMCSIDGLILGKMGHSERYGDGLYRTKTIHDLQDIFKNGVNYFKRRTEIE